MLVARPVDPTARLFMVAFLLGACASTNDGASPRAGKSDSGNGVIPTTSDGAPIGTDVSPTDRGGVTDRGPAPGTFGDRCVEHDDCLSDFCLQFEGRGVCTETCLESDSCPLDWACRIVENTPPDVISVCVPPDEVSLDLGLDGPLDAAVDLSPPSDRRLLLADEGVLDRGLPDAPVPPNDIEPPPPDAPPPDVSPDAPPPPPDMEPPPPPDLPTMAPTMAPTMPPTMPPVLRVYGEACARGSECQSDLCVADPVRGGGTCTQNCAHPQDCPDLDVCLAGAAGSICFRNETGSACSDAADCVEGICLTPPDGLDWLRVQNICVSRCAADSKCPAGYTCEVVNTNAGPARVCNPSVRRLDLCPNGSIDECLPSGQCVIPAGRDPFDIYRCIGVGGEGYCSCTCRNSVDCPSGFACYHDVALSGDAVRTGVCLAMSGYRCPVEAVNANILQCPSLACATPDEGAQASYCSSPCERDADCPAEFTCDPVDLYCVPAL